MMPIAGSSFNPPTFTSAKETACSSKTILISILSVFFSMFTFSNMDYAPKNEILIHDFLSELVWHKDHPRLLRSLYLNLIPKQLQRKRITLLSFIEPLTVWLKVLIDNKQKEYLNIYA